MMEFRVTPLTMVELRAMIPLIEFKPCCLTLMVFKALIVSPLSMMEFKEFKAMPLGI